MEFSATQASYRLLNVAMIRATTASEDSNLREPVEQIAIELAELLRIAGIQFLTFVELRMTQS